jgi:iron(III) transport system permease protein
VLVAFAGAIVTVLVCAVLSFIIVRTKFLGRAAIDYTTSIPLAFPAVVLGLGILWLYISAPFPLYGTLVGLGLAYAIRYLGYGVRSMSVGMQQVHSELSEAAYMCRAPTGRVIRTIIIPLLRPAIANTSVVIFVRFIQELNVTVLLYTQAIITVPVVMFVQLGTSVQNAVYPLALLLMLVTFLCVQVLYWLPTDVGSGASRRRRKSAELIAARAVPSEVGAHG